MQQHEQQSITRQQFVGRLQTAVIAIMLLQIVFTGLLRLFPPDLRASLAFLHRIEWGVVALLILILVQFALGWGQRIVATNRLRVFAILAWVPRCLVIERGRRARIILIGYAAIALLLVAALLWVREHGFVVQPR